LPHRFGFRRTAGPQGLDAPCIEGTRLPALVRAGAAGPEDADCHGCPEQVTVFDDDLGVCQLLSELGNIGAVEVFIHRWLGGLLDYDTAKTHSWSTPFTAT
jgi:hypothetical protein